MENEFRSLDQSFNVQDRTVRGYALLFDTLSNDLGGFKETLSKDCLEGVLERSDVFALLNHDKTKGVLARSKKMQGSLKLEIDERGLVYEFEAPKTPLGDELLSYLERGEITESSFAFKVSKDEWRKSEDGEYIRSINQIERLFDVSPVFTPAYDSTYVSVAKRSLEDFKAAEVKEDLTEYFKKLRDY